MVGQSSWSSGFYDPMHAITNAYTLLRNRTGSRLPHYRKIIQDGGNATTGLQAIWETCDIEPGNYHFQGWASATNGPYDHYCNGDILLVAPLLKLPTVPTLSSTFADNAARAKFYKRLREIRTQISGPTFLGELRESLHMIRRPADALRSSAKDYLDSLRKRKRASPKHWAKAISGTWLEHSFGWVPLLNDIKDGYAAYNRLGEKQREKVISVSFKDFADKTSTLPPADFSQRAVPYGTICFRCSNVKLLENVQVRYKGKIRARAETTAWSNAELFGFTPGEFLPTAWELLPWSFLIDYFTNIGDILSSVVTDTSDVVFVNQTIRRETIRLGRLTPDLDVSLAYWSGTYYKPKSFLSGPALNYDCRRKEVTRAAGSGISLPTLQFSFGLGNGQLANIAALLGQSRSLHPQNPRPFPYRLLGRR